MRLRAFLRRPLGVAGLLVLLALTVSALFAPQFAPADPAAIDLRAMQRPPGPEHPLGTDDLGRDVLSRLLYAGRISLALAASVTALSVVVGGVLGALAGYFGGRVDRLISLATDAFLAVPALALAMVAGSFVTPNLLTLTFVLALVSWPDLARLMRAQVIALRERTFAEAAQALGARSGRLVFRHLVPNALAPMIVAATLLAANVLLVESALSFLGYGMRPPTPSWGGMLNEAQSFYRQSPWLAVFPGLAITLTVAAINFLGDALRAATSGRSA
jgi:peptide/nickel transport system permease protein